jgi:hypothetical protein
MILLSPDSWKNGANFSLPNHRGRGKDGLFPVLNFKISLQCEIWKGLSFVVISSFQQCCVSETAVISLFSFLSMTGKVVCFLKGPHSPTHNFCWPRWNHFLTLFPWASVITTCAACLYNSHFLSPYTSPLQMSAACSCRILASAYKTTWCHNPEH